MKDDFCPRTCNSCHKVSMTTTTTTTTTSTTTTTTTTTISITTGPKECADSDETCEVLGAYCHVEALASNCPKSCGLCSDKNEETTLSSTTELTTTAMQTTPSSFSTTTIAKTLNIRASCSISISFDKMEWDSSFGDDKSFVFAMMKAEIEDVLGLIFTGQSGEGLFRKGITRLKT